MTVDATSSSTGTTATSASSSAANALSGNFDTFLKLLTTQMQNQDPLNPMDSSEFTNQLVQFSSVEQSIKTNQNLEQLISLTTSNSLSNAMGYLGKEIEAKNADMSLNGGSATWNYSLDNSAETTKLVVTDSKGKIVYKGDGEKTAGDHTFTWDGTDLNGTKLDDGGIYTLTVSSATAAGNEVTSNVTLKGTVSDVNIVNGSPVLSVNGVQVDESAISSIHEPSTTSS